MVGSLIVALTLMSPPSFAQETCEVTGLVFGFFNGVNTTEDDAKDALRLMESRVFSPETPKGETITYELFYNDSEGFSDFVETFEQRLQEHNGLLAGRYALVVNITQTAMTRFV